MSRVRGQKGRGSLDREPGIRCSLVIGRRIPADSRKRLCDVIGEILINAEEHSTSDYCFSIGYFQEYNKENEHTGVFNLVIFNYGDTIYEKFKSPECQNKNIVDRMQELSEIYIKKNFFGKMEFTEETLWTLYALQEGITSVPREKFKKRSFDIYSIEKKTVLELETLRHHGSK